MAQAWNRKLLEERAVGQRDKMISIEPLIVLKDKGYDLNRKLHETSEGSYVTLL